jgi:hypothetical protein
LAVSIGDARDVLRREKTFDQGAITDRARAEATALEVLADIVLLEKMVAAVELDSWGDPAMDGVGVPWSLEVMNAAAMVSNSCG